MVSLQSAVQSAANTLIDKLGIDVQVLDVRSLSSVTSFFIFSGATTYVHVRALEDAVRETLREEDIKLNGVDGQRGGGWRVLDYGSILVHIMEQPMRDFYGIERLWNQGKPVPIKLKSATKKTVKRKKTKKKTKKKKR